MIETKIGTVCVYLTTRVEIGELFDFHDEGSNNYPVFEVAEKVWEQAGQRYIVFKIGVVMDQENMQLAHNCVKLIEEARDMDWDADLDGHVAIDGGVEQVLPGSSPSWGGIKTGHGGSDDV